MEKTSSALRLRRARDYRQKEKEKKKKEQNEAIVSDLGKLVVGEATFTSYADSRIAKRGNEVGGGGGGRMRCVKNRRSGGARWDRTSGRSSRPHRKWQGCWNICEYACSSIAAIVADSEILLYRAYPL